MNEKANHEKIVASARQRGSEKRDETKQLATELGYFDNASNLSNDLPDGLPTSITLALSVEKSSEQIERCNATVPGVTSKAKRTTLNA